nr:unnamed protein product [Digitaria exilis]
MDHRRRRRHAAITAAMIWLVVLALGGRCATAARPLRRLHAAEGSTEASVAELDVAAAEAPETATRTEGEDSLGEEKWLPFPMPMPAASVLRFPPVAFPLAAAAAGASMPWLAGAPPAFAGIPALVPPYIGATRQEQLSLWASLFNPFQVRPKLPVASLGGGETTAAAGQVERGGGGGVPVAIASGGKAAEGETMDVPAAGALQVAEPKWGVFLGNIDRRN